MKTLEYKGFQIIDDQLSGYSLIDTKGNWAQSAITIKQLKETVNRIIKNSTNAN